MDFTNLEKNLGLKFQNQGFLKQALTHRSYLNEFKNSNLESNERLEFLGDAVLGFVVSTWLFKKFPQYFEGKLTNFRSNLVKTVSLAKIAQELEVGNYLLLSKGEKEGRGQQNPTLLANAMEAIIGAIFLDQGIHSVKVFIKTHFQKLLEEIIQSGKLKDYKSLLQEKIQAQTSESPNYKTIKEEGPEHNKIFTVSVTFQNELLAIGVGKSKQKAEEEAAHLALEKLSLKK